MRRKLLNTKKDIALKSEREGGKIREEKMRSRGEREIERKRKVGVEGGLKRELRKVSVGCTTNWLYKMVGVKMSGESREQRGCRMEFKDVEKEVS